MILLPLEKSTDDACEILSPSFIPKLLLTSGNTLEIVKSRKHDFEICRSNYDERWKIKPETVLYRAFDILRDPFRVEGRGTSWSCVQDGDEKRLFLQLRKKEGKEGRKRGGYQESLLQRRLVIQREACQLGKVARCPVMRRARRPDDEAPALYTPDMRASTTHNANKLHTI